MKKAILTDHAEERINERFTLTLRQLRYYLEKGGAITVGMQKGARLIKRLAYSPPDDEWMVVIQNVADGGVLTVMPLTFLDGRIEVTAAQKRSVRKKCLELEKQRVERVAIHEEAVKRKAERLAAAAANAPISATAPTASVEQTSKPWKLRARWRKGEKLKSADIGRIMPMYGEPETWSTLGPVHIMVQKKIRAAKIPVEAVEMLIVERDDTMFVASDLLRYLPLKPSEVDAILGNTPKTEPAADTITPPNTWRLSAYYRVDGRQKIKNLSRTLPEHGQPGDWTTPGPIHDWIRERLLSKGVQIDVVESIMGERPNEVMNLDFLLENLTSNGS